MKKSLFLFFLATCAYLLPAQDNYTYISDRKFLDVEDLIGFNFCPGKVEIKGQMDADLGPGDYSFGVTQNNLYVHGEDIEGVYSLNNINTTDYGYKMLLMNARDPRIQGHLKIIQNPKKQVEALIFKRSNKEPEMIFFQSELPERLGQEEKDFFTDLMEMEIASKDSLWGKTFYPFLKIHSDVGTQERLQPEDSVTITFVEEITIIDKTKKVKEKKKKEVVNIEMGLPDEDLDGTEENEEESEMEEVEDAISPELVVDDGAMPPVTEEMVKEAKKKIKVIKEYFVVVRSILTYEDGTTEDKTWKYPIKKITEREDQLAGPMEERFQLEISLLKGEPLYLYLTGRKTVSSFEVGPKQFLMRGH